MRGEWGREKEREGCVSLDRERERERGVSGGGRKREGMCQFREREG